jgi:peptidoglycan/LPS O-acetylase OafA/YrhL
MNRGLSLYLDLVRFAAALAVLVTHLAYAELSGGMLSYWRLLGNDAVMVFFVLSGFVIAWVSQEKERTLADYTTSRLARLWSVAVPALALTVLLDQWGRQLDPAHYSQWWYQAGDPLWRAVRALSFTNELWFSSVRPFSNGPWWSLGYEAVYYAIFAALAYFAGWKRALLAGALALAAGPKIMLLFPIWWFGVWTWRRTQRGALPAGEAAVLFAGTIAAYALFRASGLPVLLRGGTSYVLGPDNVGTYLHFSDEFLSSYVIGWLVALHFLAAHGLSASLERWLSPWRRPIVWCAQSTFALYLLHYPLLRFADAAFAHDATNPWHVAALFAGVAGTCLAIGPLIERTKRGWKRLLTPRRTEPAAA